MQLEKNFRVDFDIWSLNLTQFFKIFTRILISNILLYKLQKIPIFMHEHFKRCEPL